MKIVKYIESWFETDGAGNSVAKFLKGSFHPISDDTNRHVALGAAVIVDAPADAEKAESAAEKAVVKAEEASAAAGAAREASEAASAAASIAPKSPKE